jgi:hypothetical protein
MRRSGKKKKKNSLLFLLTFPLFRVFLSFLQRGELPAAPLFIPPLLLAKMPPSPVCFSAVYRGRDALASYASSASGSSSSASAASAVNNFRAVAASCLERCPPGGEAK